MELTYIVFHITTYDLFVCLFRLSYTFLCQAASAALFIAVVLLLFAIMFLYSSYNLIKSHCAAGVKRAALSRGPVAGYTLECRGHSYRPDRPIREWMGAIICTENNILHHKAIIRTANGNHWEWMSLVWLLISWRHERQHYFIYIIKNNRWMISFCTVFVLLSCFHSVMFPYCCKVFNLFVAVMSTFCCYTLISLHRSAVVLLLGHLWVTPKEGYLFAYIKYSCWRKSQTDGFW